MSNMGNDSPNIDFNREPNAKVEERMKKGGYSSPEDVVRAGLASLGQGEGERDFEPGELAELLAVADEEIERGELIDGESVFQEIRDLSKARRTLMRHRNKSNHS